MARNAQVTGKPGLVIDEFTVEQEMTLRRYLKKVKRSHPEWYAAYMSLCRELGINPRKGILMGEWADEA